MAIPMRWRVALLVVFVKSVVAKKRVSAVLVKSQNVMKMSAITMAQRVKMPMTIVVQVVPTVIRLAMLRQVHAIREQANARLILVHRAITSRL
jgi:hypothetical protein